MRSVEAGRQIPTTIGRESTRDKKLAAEVQGHGRDIVDPLAAADAEKLAFYEGQVTPVLRVFEPEEQFVEKAPIRRPNLEQIRAERIDNLPPTAKAAHEAAVQLAADYGPDVPLVSADTLDFPFLGRTLSTTNHLVPPASTELSSPYTEAPSGDERIMLIEKGISMKDASDGFTAREFLGLTDIAVRLSTRIKLVTDGADEAITTFPSAKRDGSRIEVHHKHKGEGVNVVFRSPDGTPTKRIVVGENITETQVGPDTNPRHVLDEADKGTRNYPGTIIFDETDPEQRFELPLSREDAKFVGMELFKAALTPAERVIAQQEIPSINAIENAVLGKK